MDVVGVTILAEDGIACVVQSPANVQKALRDYWAPVYSVKPADEAKAKTLLDRYYSGFNHLFTFASIPP